MSYSPRSCTYSDSLLIASPQAGSDYEVDPSQKREMERTHARREQRRIEEILARQATAAQIGELNDDTNSQEYVGTTQEVSMHVDTRAESPETMSDAPKPSESELLARCRTAEAERDAVRRELKQTKKKLRDANLELQQLNLTLASSYDDVNTAIGLLNTAQTKLSTIEILSD
ncbi:hypothetical protein C8R44DRAFT_869266 [Mycena epipterygia]|nr:hypothetical protein C8R44DRAFT_874709 [Mycena epipterygia]KAJ7137207.1 hypothetical protein C8R44DRAFT_869266 [Mycena epipterygia]